MTYPTALYTSLITHHNALKSLQRELKKHLEREKQLSDILDTLRHGYNPNYQDMAVLEAVRGWEYLAGIPHTTDADREEGSDEEDEVISQVDGAKVELEEGEWSTQELEQGLDELLSVDHMSLLIEHDSYVDEPASVSSDFLIPQYGVVRDTLVSWLQVLGIVKGSSTASSGWTSHVGHVFLLN